MPALPLVLTLVVALTSAQLRRDAPPDPVGTGRIAGTVVDHESGRPVRFASVSLFSSDVHRTAITDGSGTFSFDRLAAGAYRVRVEKPGYLETAYGQARPGTDTPGKYIHLGDRQPVARITIPLSHGGVISGTIRDDRGDPIFNAMVSVARWITAHGVRQLEELDAVRTDERGNYRIALLAPRDYVLIASPPEFGVPTPPPQMPPVEDHRSQFDFVTMFYPGVPSATSAESIRLGLGELRSNVDLALPLVAVGWVTGIVLDTGGKPAAGVEVTLLTPREITSGVTGRTTPTDETGRFQFDNVVPGAYTVMASTIAQGESITLHSSFFKTSSGMRVTYADRSPVKAVAEPEAAPAATTRPPGFALSEVSVTGGSASNVTLTMEAARKVTGRVVFEGAAKPPAAREIGIDLSALRGPSGPGVVTPNDDGTFEIAEILPGRYSIGVGLSGAPWSLASAMAGGVDVLDAFLDVPRDRDVRDLTITFRDRETELTGSVLDSAGRPAGERVVVVFPADERLWSGYLRIQADPLYADGAYVFRDLRPGRYLLALVDGVEAGEWLDPAFLRSLMQGAVPVTIGDGERKVQNLRVR